MSEKTTYRIACPQCRHEQSVELYESVNVTTDPELRGELLENRLNIVACGGCKLNFRVDKQLVYSDPGRKFIVFLFPAEGDACEKGEDQFLAGIADITRALPDDVPAPSLNLVFNRTELVERIFMKEAGLDERIIEYIKYTMYTRNAHKLDPAAKALLFNANDSNETTLCFVAQDLKTRKFEAVLSYDRKGYDALETTFSDEEKAFDLLELFPGPHISARHNLLRELHAETEQENED